MKGTFKSAGYVDQSEAAGDDVQADVETENRRIAPRSDKIRRNKKKISSKFNNSAIAETEATMTVKTTTIEEATIVIKQSLVTYTDKLWEVNQKVRF